MNVPKQKVKPEFKMGEFLCLRNLDTNAVIGQLEENMRLREMPVEKQAMCKLKKPKVRE